MTVPSCARLWIDGAIVRTQQWIRRCAGPSNQPCSAGGNSSLVFIRILFSRSYQPVQQKDGQPVQARAYMRTRTRVRTCPPAHKPHSKALYN